MSPKDPAEAGQQVLLGNASRVGREGRIASGLLFPRETNTRTRARIAGEPRSSVSHRTTTTVFFPKKYPISLRYPKIFSTACCGRFSKNWDSNFPPFLRQLRNKQEIAFPYRVSRQFPFNFFNSMNILVSFQSNECFIQPLEFLFKTRFELFKMW